MKQPLIFCHGPHHGLCPNRMARLAIELRQQEATVGKGKTIVSLRHLVELGWGDEDVGCAAPDGAACPDGADKPYFDEDTFELSVRGEVVYTFASQASNQIAVLKAFQAQGWPREILDPLGNAADVDFVRRLHNTRHALNCAVRRWGIVFSASAVRRKIRWRYCPAEE